MPAQPVPGRPGSYPYPYWGLAPGRAGIYPLSLLGTCPRFLPGGGIQTFFPTTVGLFAGFPLP